MPGCNRNVTMVLMVMAAPTIGAASEKFWPSASRTRVQTCSISIRLVILAA